MVIKEFLAALGVQDNFTGPLNNILNKGKKGVQGFASIAAKQFALATVAVAAFFVMAGKGVISFAQKLVSYDKSVKDLSKSLGISREEAYNMQAALNAMGKTMEEIRGSPELISQFEKLKAVAKEMKPPDMTDGISQLKEFGDTWQSIKMSITMGLQWVGFFFLKHVQKPLSNLQNMLRSWNDRFGKSLPKVSEIIGQAMAGIVRIITRVIQVVQKGGELIFKLLDRIPGKIKIIGLAILGINAFLKMGPLGKFITLISLALLLVDDFFTYLEGGESLLAPLWEKLTGLFSGFKDSGKGVLDWFAEDFIPLLINGIVELIPIISKKALEILDALLKVLFDNLPAILDMGVKILTALVMGIISATPELLESSIAFLNQLLEMIADYSPQLVEMGMNLLLSLWDGTLSAMPGILKALPGLMWQLLKGIMEFNKKMPEIGINLIKALWKGIISMGDWLRGKVSNFFGGIWDSVKSSFGGNPKDSPDIGHAEGGIFSNEHTARFAEGNKPEAIVPLTKPKRAAQVMSGIAKYFGVGNADTDLTPIISGISNISKQLVGTVNAINQVLTGTRNVSKSENISNTNKTATLKSDIKIYDNSGKPQQTANATARAQRGLIRDLQGVMA